METNKTIKCENCNAILTNYFDENELKNFDEQFVKNNYETCIGDLTVNAALQIKNYFENKYKNFNNKQLFVDIENDVKHDSFEELCENYNHVVITIELSEHENYTKRHNKFYVCESCEEVLTDYFTKKQLDKIYKEFKQEVMKTDDFYENNWFCVNNLTLNAAKQVASYFKDLFENNEKYELEIEINEETDGCSCKFKESNHRFIAIGLRKKDE